MRGLKNNNQGDIGGVGQAIAITIALIMSLLIIYSIAVSINAHTLDAKFAATPASGMPGTASLVGNSTNSTLSGLQTFYTISPLIIIVIAAVIILGYVTKFGQGQE